MSRIAPLDEPGTPLVIHGRVLAQDTRTPVPDAVVFAYHTDRDGLYDNPGSPPHSWRLRGWSRTDREGRFEFETMRPGPYPASRVAAHVHFVVFASDARYGGGELRFEDDTFVTVRSVDTLVKRLRKKIESNPARPTYIVTVRGIGYKLSAQ